jgi:acetoacetyl-CoA synthetase
MAAEPIWQPSRERIASSHLARFMSCVTARHGTRFASYDELHAWSIREPALFWQELAAFSDTRAQWGEGPVLQNPDAMPGARWFGGSQLSFAANLLRYKGEEPAIIFANEAGMRRVLSWRDLHAEVTRVAAGLRELGVSSGDRVAGFLPNVPEAIVAMLAATSLGAVWSSCSPDFGVQGVLDRFGQIAPKVLFCADGYVYAGKRIESLPTVASVLAKVPSIERAIVVTYIGRSDPSTVSIEPLGARALPFESFGTRAGKLAPQLTAFDHPLYILYSSGTTGVPKCIVHGVGGTLLQHQKEHLLHTDLRRGDRFFYFTTCGWMMWNWLVSGLASGATLVLYEGSPFHPDAGVLWRLAEELSISIFGTSAKYLQAMEKSDFRPARAVSLPALRTVLSTGSPLPPEGFDYVYRDVKPDVQLASISGGTDIVSCFVLGNPLLPVHRGEIQCAGLGMAVEIFDDEGHAVRGVTGELVCTRPFPSMPVGFWNDPDGGRYRAAYFERFPEVWHHGDYAMRTSTNGFVIFGRSDAVLNPGGVRIGTSEIYRQVEKLPEVLESIAVGQEWDTDVRVVLFVRLAAGVVLDEALRRKIREVIRTNTTPRHVPAKIIAVPDIPRTISGKLTELAVRNVIHGRAVRNTDALANPHALEHFRNLDELAS